VVAGGGLVLFAPCWVQSPGALLTASTSSESWPSWWPKSIPTPFGGPPPAEMAELTCWSLRGTGMTSTRSKVLPDEWAQAKEDKSNTHGEQ
jgi:hypothetical protein